MAKPTAPHLFNNAAGLAMAYKLDYIWTCWEGSGVAYSQNRRPLATSLTPAASAGWSTDADGPVIRTNDAVNGWFSVDTQPGGGEPRFLVDMPDGTITMAAYTFALHLTVRSTSHNDSGIFYWGQTNKQKGLFIADHTARTITFQLDTGSAAAYVTTTSAAYTVGTKFWLIGVYDGSLTAADRLKIYINGTSVGVTLTGTPAASVNYSPDPGFRTLYVGSKTGIAADAAALDISLIYTWQRALSSSDVSSLVASPYQFLSTALTGTVSTADYDLYWGCDPQVGTTTPEDVRLASHPNSDSAKAAFLALITSPDVGTFETFVDDVAVDGTDTHTGTITLSATSGASVTVTSTATEFLATSNGVFAGTVLTEFSGPGVASVISRDSTTQLTVRVLTTFSGLTFTPGQLQIHRVGFYGANNAALYISGGASGSFVNQLTGGSTNAGRYPVNGDYYLQFVVEGPTLRFLPATTGFGIYFVDPADFSGVDGFGIPVHTRINYELTFSDSTTLDISLPGLMADSAGMPAAGAIAYYGYIVKGGKTVRSLKLTMKLVDGSSTLGDVDIIGLDDVTWAIASQIPSLPSPEPPVTYLTPTSTLLAIPEVCAEDETGTLTLCRRCHYLYVRGKWMAHVCTPRWTSRTFIRGW